MKATDNNKRPGQLTQAPSQFLSNMEVDLRLVSLPNKMTGSRPQAKDTELAQCIKDLQFIHRLAQSKDNSQLLKN